jgi:hypothetical protein
LILHDRHRKKSIMSFKASHEYAILLVDSGNWSAYANYANSSKAKLNKKHKKKASA